MPDSFPLCSIKRPRPPPPISPTSRTSPRLQAAGISRRSLRRRRRPPPFPTNVSPLDLFRLSLHTRHLPAHLLKPFFSRRTQQNADAVELAGGPRSISIDAVAAVLPALAVTSNIPGATHRPRRHLRHARELPEATIHSTPEQHRRHLR